jgi:hypothetical protein
LLYLFGRGCDLLGLKIWNLTFGPKSCAFRLAVESGEDGKTKDYSEFISDHIFSIQDVRALMIISYSSWAVLCEF